MKLVERGIVSKRSDMSTYLVHWTTKNNFDRIVRFGYLVPSFAEREYDIYNNAGRVGPTIPGPREAVCFTEMPIGNWIQSITANFRYSDRRWGIAIPKEILYSYGACPVLYVSKPDYKQEGPKCPEEELWDKCPDDERFRLFNFRYIPKPDWTHEREWRVCVNTEINEKIGFGSSSTVPIHLSDLIKIGPKDVPLVIIVESESDKESAKNKKANLNPAIVVNQRSK